ncbi:MAG: prolipoprotein diacylglyceryl transferase [Planctomycetaceae bacterium]|nr:prolipoprotein diacylglyceryl transferase [Planctomycetaceae bacterium]
MDRDLDLVSVPRASTFVGVIRGRIVARPARRRIASPKPGEESQAPPTRGTIVPATPIPDPRRLLFEGGFAVGTLALLFGLGTAVDRLLRRGADGLPLHLPDSLRLLAGLGVLGGAARLILTRTGRASSARASQIILPFAVLAFLALGLAADSPGSLTLAPLLAIACAAFSIEADAVEGRRHAAAPDHACGHGTPGGRGPGHSRSTIAGFVEASLDALSRLINRPLIVRQGQVILFLGYGIWLGLGTFVWLLLTEAVLLGQGVAPRLANGIVLGTGIAGVAGARWAYRIFMHLGGVVSFASSRKKVGFVSWGAGIGVALFAAVISWCTGISAWTLTDAAGPPLMLAQVFGRIGCAFYGCCYGKETSSPLCLTYTSPALKVLRERQIPSTRVIPVQLLAALHGAFIFAYVTILWWHSPLLPGEATILAVVLYSLCRAAEEFLRDHHVVRSQSVLSPTVKICAALTASGVLALWLDVATWHAGARLTLAALDASAIRAHTGLLVPLVGGLGGALIYSYHYNNIGNWDRRVRVALASPGFFEGPARGRTGADACSPAGGLQ